MDVEKELKKLYPNGHPAFLPKLVELAKLHSDKNFDYAHGGDPLGNFDRVASILSLYPKLSLNAPAVVALVYMLKQLDCVLHALDQHYTLQVEEVGKRLDDVAVYAILAGLMLGGKWLPKDM
jgi:hypothetical protein